MREIVRTLLIAAVILITFTGCVGTYIVDFALERQDLNYRLLPGDKNKEPSLIPEDQPHVKENYKKMSEEAATWAEQTEHEDWTEYTSDGLKLYAEFFPVENSHKYAIMIHGYTGKGEDLRVQGMYFHQWGFNVLIPDNRSHGKSEGKYIGMGYLDSNDILLWIKRIVDNDPDCQITMLGVSMGGATVMMTSGLELPENVKCLIEDCGYTSVWDQFEYVAKTSLHLPSWPALNWADRAAKKRVGYSFREASSIDRLKQNSTPMLFIHGTADSFVPYYMLDENVQACGDVYHEVLRVENASHWISVFTEPELYINTVKNFVERFIPDEKQ